MKRNILLVLGVCLLLVGCKSGKVLECTFTDKNSNMILTITQKYTFDKEGKSIKKIKKTTKYELTEKYLKFLKENKMNVEDTIDVDAICSSTKMLDNASCKSSVKDNVITIENILKIDEDTKSIYDGDYEYFEKFFKEQKYECK